LISSKKARRLYGKCNQILNNLLTVTGLPRETFKLHIIKEEIPNAYIFTGSREIYTTTALLEGKDMSEGEYAAILSHEIAHYLKSSKIKPQSQKNKTYKLYEVWAKLAQRQFEEFEADELALIIMDAAGYSVNEALSITKKLSLNTNPNSTDTRWLDPTSTHPDWGARLAKTESNIENLKFLWKNINNVKKQLLNTKEKSQLYTHSLLESSIAKIKKIALPTELDLPSSVRLIKFHKLNIHLFPVFWERLKKMARDPSLRDPFNLETVDYLSQKYSFKKDFIVFVFYYILHKQKIELSDQLSNFILQLKKRELQGDFVSTLYLKALICVICSKSCTGKTLIQKIKWLREKCNIKQEEILLALMELLDNVSFLFFEDFNLEEASPLFLYYINKLLPFNYNLEEILAPFSYSDLRDLFLLKILSVHTIIPDAERYVDLSLDKFFKKKLSTKELVARLKPDAIRLFNAPPSDDIYKPTERLGEYPYDQDMMEMHDLDYFILEEGFPYSIKKFEASFREENTTAKILAVHTQESIIEAYLKRKKTAEKHTSKTIKKRALTYSRLILAKKLEKIPADQWNNHTIKFIEALPPSNEKNLLVILMAKAGRRNVLDSELKFETVKMKTSSASFLDFFGFVDTDATEEIYPTGQRMLDSFLAERLPKTGTIELKTACSLIPRPSPGRDKILDRVESEDLKEAELLLNAYFSPPAAYAKAYQISKGWINSPSGQETKTFEDIFKLTKKYPSLKRRMTKEWTNRFGVSKTIYPKAVKAYSEVDATDILKGITFSETKKASVASKIAICLGTFTPAITKEDFSFLSIQRQDSETSPETYEEEDDDESSYEQREDPIGRYYDPKEMLAISNYYPLLPSSILMVSQIIQERIPFSIHTIPMVDDMPRPQPFFKKSSIEEEISQEIKEMKQWDITKSFFSFMSAVGWEESSAFYEEALIDLSEDKEILARLEKIFLKGIGLILQTEKVSLSAAKATENGLENLLKNQNLRTRIKIWAKILAGIAQKQPIEEITREAVKPLGIDGKKLMQPIHSLTSGVEPKLEQATRLSLSDTSSLDLLDGIKFLAFRGLDPFAIHEKYSLLGSGSIRTAISGENGRIHDEAFLIVHAPAMDVTTRDGIYMFITDMRKKEIYFPLTPEQYIIGSRQAEDERRNGFLNHNGFGEFFGWKLGNLTIPKILEAHPELGYARMEWVKGKSFNALTKDEKDKFSPLVIEGVTAQFMNPTPKGVFLFNPEFHEGNLTLSMDNKLYLTDCGLTTFVTASELLSFISTISSFRGEGLPGAAAMLLQQGNIQHLSQLRKGKESQLISALKVISQKREIVSSPESLLSEVAAIAAKTSDFKITSGFDSLSRGFQYLAPYIRRSGQIPSLAFIPQIQKMPLADEIKEKLAPSSDDKTSKTFLPSGMEIGKKLRDGSINTLGVITTPTTLFTFKTELGGKEIQTTLVECQLGEGTVSKVPPSLLMVKKQGGWVSYEDFLKTQ